MQMKDGKLTTDYAGVVTTRDIGTLNLNIVDPFLLVDFLESDNADNYITGIPPHPHRGFWWLPVTDDRN